MQFQPAGRNWQVKSAFRRSKVLLLKAVAGAQRPEEANYCLQEAEKSDGECSLSRQEGPGKLKVHSGSEKVCG
jgi:hypothetical protein